MLPSLQLKRVEQGLDEKIGVLEELNQRLAANVRILRHLLEEKRKLATLVEPAGLQVPNKSSTQHAEENSSRRAEKEERSDPTPGAAEPKEELEDKLNRILTLAKQTRVSKTTKGEQEKAGAKTSKRGSQVSSAAPKPESLRAAIAAASSKPPPSTSAKSDQPPTEVASTDTAVLAPQPKPKLAGTLPRQLVLLRTRRSMLQSIIGIVFAAQSSRLTNAGGSTPWVSILALVLPPDITRSLKSLPVDASLLSAERAKFATLLRDASESAALKRTPQELHQLLDLWYKALIVGVISLGVSIPNAKRELGFSSSPIPLPIITAMDKFRQAGEGADFFKLSGKWQRHTRARLAKRHQWLLENVLLLCESAIGKAMLPFVAARVARCIGARCDDRQWRAVLYLLRSLISLLQYGGAESHCVHFVNKSIA